MPRYLVADELLERRITTRRQLRDAPAPNYRIEARPSAGVGNFYGGVLLVGEQSANPGDSVNQEPFCSKLGCSGWLNSLLEREQLPEERFYWLNALNNDGTEVDARSVVDSLKPSLTIALGKVAERALSDQNVLHVAVPHPQYWKRFRSKERYPLLDVLARAPKRLIELADGAVRMHQIEERVRFSYDPWYSLFIDDRLVKQSQSFTALFRMSRHAAHRGGKQLTLTGLEWLKLDLGLTDRDEVRCMSSELRTLLKMPFTV